MPGPGLPPRSHDVERHILIGFGAVFVLVVAITGIAYVGLRHTRESQRRVLQQNFAAVVDVARLRANASAERQDLALILDRPKSQWSPWQEDLAAREQEDAAILQRLPRFLADKPRATSMVSELHDLQHSTVEARRTEFVEALERGDLAVARALFTGPHSVNHLRFMELVRRLEQSETDAAEAVIAASARRADLLVGILLGSGVAAVLGALVVGGFMYRSVRAYVAERQHAESALSRNAALLRSLIEASLDPLVTIGPTGKITDVNVATELATGRSRQDLVGTDFCDYFSEPTQARAGYEQVFREGVVRDYPLELRHRDGHAISVLYNASVYRDEHGAVIGVFAAARDVTVRNRIEGELRRANRALRATTGCNQAVVHAQSEIDLLQHICRVVVDDAGYRMAWIGVPLDDENRTVRPVASSGQEMGYLDSARFSWADNEFGRGPTGTAIRTLKPTICRDMLSDPRFAPWRSEAVKRGYASSIVLPFVIDGRAAAAVSIYAPEPDAFDEAETKWLTAMAEDVGYGIAALRMREQRLVAERALERANAYNRSLIEASLDPLVTIGPDGRIMDVNVATEAATGRTRAELVGTDFSDYFADRDAAQAGYRQVFRDGLVRDYALDLRHRDGHVMSVLYNASVFRDDRGQVAGVFAAARDMTDRKRAEAVSAQLAAIVESSDDAIISQDLDGTILTWNEGARRLYGYAAEEMIGQPVMKVAPADREHELRGLLPRIATGDHIEHYETVWVRKDGSIADVSITLSPVKGATGGVVGASAIVRDITDRKRAEQNIRRYADELQRSNQELERFAYVASHDLQEPLRTVSSFSELLSRRYQGKLDRDADEFIQFIVSGASRMQTLINDLLTFSRVDSRGKPFRSYDANAALATALANLDAAVREAQAEVTHDPLPEVLVDATQLVQVLQNLIGNAVKFRRADERIRVHVGARRAGNAWEFSVRDNGIGIEPRYFDRIFIIFQRLHALDQYPGTGIGLAICKKIVERHGGRMWVESAPGCGSTFFFTLPIERPS